MVLKLYAVSDGPTSLSVRQLLHQLQIPFELISVDYNKGEHMTEDYAKVIINYTHYVSKIFNKTSSVLF